MDSVQTIMDVWRIKQQFLRRNPPTYTGMRRGRPARDWIYEMERIFQELRAPDGHLRVQLAVERFTRDALIWWKIVPTRYRVERLLWRDFVDLFCRHHCTVEYQIEMWQIDLRKRRRVERIERLKRQRRMRDKTQRATRQAKGMILIFEDENS